MNYTSKNTSESPPQREHGAYPAQNNGNASGVTVPDPPPLVLPGEKPDATLLPPNAVTQVDRERAMLAAINQNFCFVASMLGVTGGAVMGAFDGYRLGKEASLNVLAQRRDSIDLVRLPILINSSFYLF